MTETAVETAVETTTTVDAASSLPTPNPTAHKSDPVIAKHAPPVNTPSPRSPLGAKILAAPSHLDAFLSHLHRCTKTRGGTDVVLLFTTYVLRFTSAVIDDASRSVLHLHARRLIDLFYKLPPSSSVVAPAPPALAALARRFSARLKVLVGMLGEWRTMNRMWGVMGMYFAAKELLRRHRADKAEGKSIEVFDTAVEASQVALLTLYHVSEATAWLSHKKVLPFSLHAQGRLSAWSVQAWATYVVIDMIKMFAQRIRRVKSADEAENKRFNAEWIKEFLRTSAWAPLTVHWSLPNGLLPEILVAFFALYPSTGYMKDLWRDTA